MSVALEKYVQTKVTFTVKVVSLQIVNVLTSKPQGAKGICHVKGK